MTAKLKNRPSESPENGWEQFLNRDSQPGHSVVCTLRYTAVHPQQWCSSLQLQKKPPSLRCLYNTENNIVRMAL